MQRKHSRFYDQHEELFARNRINRVKGYKEGALLLSYIPAEAFTPNMPSELVGQLANGKHYRVPVKLERGYEIIDYYIDRL